MLKSLICPFFIFCICAPASASEDVAIGDWLTTIDNDTCWMAAHPFSQPSSEAGRKFHQDIYFNVAFKLAHHSQSFQFLLMKLINIIKR